MDYTVVIRTLGTAGEKYQRTLDSLVTQTIPPCDIFVYIAEEYPLPKETCGKEKYVYVKKGMVAQRALPYAEIKTEWILFLDDDVYLPSAGVEQMYDFLKQEQADVIAPELFEHVTRDWQTNLRMHILGKSVPRKDDGVWAYKVLNNAGYSYNENPKKTIYLSQSNAGPCFFCRKNDFLSIRFEEELWLDAVSYALPEDQVMFYKFYVKGYKILTWYNSDIIHLDAGASRVNSIEKELGVLYSEIRNRLIFWHRFIYLRPECMWNRFGTFISISYVMTLRVLLMLAKGRIQHLSCWRKGLCDAVRFIRSEEYKQLPRVYE